MDERAKSTVAGYAGLFVLISVAIALGLLFWRACTPGPRPEPPPAPIDAEVKDVRPEPPEAAGEADTVAWNEVYELEQVKGKWVGRFSEELTITERAKKELSPYPWKMVLVSPMYDKPLRCGFYAALQLTDSKNPGKDLWRIAWCSGGELPADAGLYAKRLTIQSGGDPESLQLYVDNIYGGTFHRAPNP